MTWHGKARTSEHVLIREPLMFWDVLCHVSFDKERQKIAAAQALQPPIDLPTGGSSSLLDIGLLLRELCLSHTSHGTHCSRNAPTP